MNLIPYFRLDGTASRTALLHVVLAGVLSYAMLGLSCALLKGGSALALSGVVIFGMGSALGTAAYLATLTRRLTTLGSSRWWLLGLLFPFAGLLLLVHCLWTKDS